MTPGTGQVPAEAVGVAINAAYDYDKARYFNASKSSVGGMSAALAAAAPLIAADKAMYEIAYWAVEKVLDEALGTEEEDGSGGGIAAEVYLLMEQRNQARAEVARLTAERIALADKIEAAAEASFEDSQWIGGMYQAASMVRTPGGPR